MDPSTPYIPTVKKSGYMEKRRRNLMMSWRQYWFVLDGKLLMYYRTREDYKKLAPCKGSINLGLAQVVRPAHGVIRYPIEIITRTKKIYLATKDKEDRLQWVQVLQEALQIPYSSPRNSIAPGSFRYSQEDLRNEQRVSMISSCDLITKRRTDDESGSSSSDTLLDTKPQAWDKAQLRNGSIASNGSDPHEDMDTISRIRKLGGYSIHNNNMGVALQLNEAIARRARKCSENAGSESPDEVRGRAMTQPRPQSPLSITNEKGKHSTIIPIESNGVPLSSPKPSGVSRSSKKGRAPAIPRSQNLQKLIPPEETFECQSERVPTPKPRKTAPSSHVNSLESLTSSTGSGTLPSRGLRERSQSHDVLNKSESELRKKSCNNSTVYLNAQDGTPFSNGSVYVSDTTLSAKPPSRSTEDLTKHPQNVTVQWCPDVTSSLGVGSDCQPVVEEVIVPRKKEKSMAPAQTIYSAQVRVTNTTETPVLPFDLDSNNSPEAGPGDVKMRMNPNHSPPIILEPVNEQVCVKVQCTSRENGKLGFTTPVQVVDSVESYSLYAEAAKRESERKARLSFALPQEVFVEAEFCNELHNIQRSKRVPDGDLPRPQLVVTDPDRSSQNFGQDSETEGEEEDEVKLQQKEKQRLLDLHPTLHDLRSSGIDHFKELLQFEADDVRVQNEGRINKLGYSVAVTQLKQKCSEADPA